MVEGGVCKRSPLLTGTTGAGVLGMVEQRLDANGIWKASRGVPQCAGGTVLRHSQLNLGLSPLPGLAWNYGLYLDGQGMFFCGSFSWYQTPSKVSIVCSRQLVIM